VAFSKRGERDRRVRQEDEARRKITDANSSIQHRVGTGATRTNVAVVTWGFIDKSITVDMGVSGLEHGGKGIKVDKATGGKL
jgi:hypothetical protein